MDGSSVPVNGGTTIPRRSGAELVKLPVLAAYHPGFHRCPGGVSTWLGNRRNRLCWRATPSGAAQSACNLRQQVQLWPARRT